MLCKNKSGKQIMRFTIWSVRLLLCNIKNPRYTHSGLPSLAASVLDGWKLVVGLDEGLSQTIAYFRKNMNQVV